LKTTILTLNITLTSDIALNFLLVFKLTY